MDVNRQREHYRKSYIVYKRQYFIHQYLQVLSRLQRVSCTAAISDKYVQITIISKHDLQQMIIVVNFVTGLCAHIWSYTICTARIIPRGKFRSSGLPKLLRFSPFHTEGKECLHYMYTLDGMNLMTSQNSP